MSDRNSSFLAGKLPNQQQDNTWASQLPQFTSSNPIAYFSIEFGLDSLPTYSGGLGILAGDYLKSASDLGLPVVGIGLLYSQGYFTQRLNAGRQEEYYQDYDFNQLPLELCRDELGEVLTVTVGVAESNVKAQVWLARVGQVKLYFLDVNLADNCTSDRSLTARLYGGDKETRIAQEIILGIGGVRLLQLLNLKPHTYHLNEGHAAFALLELARQTIESTGKSFAQAVEAMRPACVFTTHTPVPAGHDTFSPELMQRYFGQYYPQLGLTQEAFLELGHAPEDSDTFNMTALALRLCRAVNGVSKLNGQVCRQMWSKLYPHLPVEQVPISSITNGVHAPTWVAPEMADLYAQYIDANWLDRITDTQWAKVDEIPDEELWQRHQQLKARLINFVCGAGILRSENIQGTLMLPIPQKHQAAQILDPEALTLGVARRFSTYKRGDLIMHDVERAKRILTNAQKPVQIIFAGKAHPADEESKKIIQRIIEWSQDPDIQNRVVFLENYNMDIATQLVQGVDVWLNTPQRPKEASGTSGQKVCLNGGLHCSVLDGWWPEAYQAGCNGWAIGDGEVSDNEEEQNQRDASAMYTLLEQEIIPCFYDRDASGLPLRWIQIIKASIKTIVPQFNTNRMVMEYVTQMYLY
ncbi:alpha-glucan family phosphorylase [Iningainema tapete]|uniref:Alpha-glucan family phosphorylase n=1 Tax=Iningainema tapete BLCC-T55 TaxID=2748662 RepID=A0A8J6XE27_9CYAN|nr:alpha-glucan family phosphorylase [Iningainema tapete]MBD2773694.1 alpha-glucan family phosphorylase [Iningainema tapete BLCC-T55]